MIRNHSCVIHVAHYRHLHSFNRPLLYHWDYVIGFWLYLWQVPDLLYPFPLVAV